MAGSETTTLAGSETSTGTQSAHMGSAKSSGLACGTTWGPLRAQICAGRLKRHSCGHTSHHFDIHLGPAESSGLACGTTRTAAWRSSLQKGAQMATTRQHHHAHLGSA